MKKILLAFFSFCVATNLAFSAPRDLTDEELVFAMSFQRFYSPQKKTSSLIFPEQIDGSQFVFTSNQIEKEGFSQYSLEFLGQGTIGYYFQTKDGYHGVGVGLFTGHGVYVAEHIQYHNGRTVTTMWKNGDPILEKIIYPVAHHQKYAKVAFNQTIGKMYENPSRSSKVATMVNLPKDAYYEFIIEANPIQDEQNETWHKLVFGYKNGKVAKLTHDDLSLVGAKWNEAFFNDYEPVYVARNDVRIGLLSIVDVLRIFSHEKGVY